MFSVFVICIQVLEHLRHPFEVVKEIGRVIKNDGKIFLTAPQGWYEHQIPNDFYRFTSFALRDIFESAGFKIESIEPIGGYFIYIGNRIAHLPKVVFAPLSNSIFRVILFPIEFFCLFIFSIVTPIICNLLDILDREKNLTLGYRCKAIKIKI